MTPSQQAKHLRLQEDLFFFASKAPLIIKTKSGDLVPLALNKAQRYIHDQCERQLARIGKVRKIIVKARQEGASTYIAARFYHKTTRRKGTSTFILAHDTDTTAKLFNMVKRFNDNIHQALKPPEKSSNRKELKFEAIESDYAVGTAGNDSGGRGGTVQLFHGSEVAYWQNTDEIKKGVMESVPDLQGTEMILESTANGIGNMFHELAMAALEGKGDYELIFVPWFWMEEYSRDEIPEDFELTDREEQYMELHDLTLEQMVWRRAKIETLGNGNYQRGEDSFKQEYPATVEEAFATSTNKFFDPNTIQRARKSTITDKQAPLIMGVDPARDGDRTVIVFRRGREVPKYYVWTEMDSMQLAGICAKFINEHKPDAVFVDSGLGEGTVDRLHELGYEDMVHAVHFGEGATDPKIYANKRAEMYGEARDWLEDKGGASLPDCSIMHKDLAVIPKFKTSSNGRNILPPKETISSDCGFSPDIADAFVLTFAYPVQHRVHRQGHSNTQVQKSEGGLRSMNRYRKAG